MSVVGLTLGSGAKATRPSAASAASVATSASTFDDGCARSYQAKPAGERERRGGANGGELPASREPAPARVSRRRAALGALARAQRRPRRRGCARSRWRSTSRRRGPPRPARRRRPPVGQQHDALGEGGGELGVVGGDEHGGPAAASSRRRSASVALGGAVHPRVGSSRQHDAAGGSPPPSTIASASRWRSPPERSRGWRSASAASPAAASAARGDLVADALGQEVVAGVLEQQRDAPGRARRVPRVGCASPASVAQQRRLARAVAAHQRDALAGREREVDAAQDRRPPAARARRREAQRGGGAAVAAAAGASRSGVAGGSAGAAARRAASEPVGAQRGARLLDARPAAGAARRAAKSRAPGVCSAGACAAAHSRNARGGASQATRAVVEHERRGRRRPGSARGGARRARSPSPTPR